MPPAAPRPSPLAALGLVVQQLAQRLPHTFRLARIAREHPCTHNAGQLLREGLEEATGRQHERVCGGSRSAITMLPCCQ